MTARNDSSAMKLQHRCMAVTTAEIAAFPATEGSADLSVGTGMHEGLVATFFRWWTDSDATPTMASVLAMWRRAERDLDAATPGSDSWTEASERFIAARSEYRRLFTLAAAEAESLRRAW